MVQKQNVQIQSVWMKQATLQFHKVAPEIVHNGAMPQRHRAPGFLGTPNINKYHIVWVYVTCPITICVVDYIPLST